jgi:hypothetical protein
MKGSKQAFLTLLFGALLVSFSSASAQSVAPSSQLGIGVNTSGMTVQYAITPGIHVGAAAALVFQSGDNSSTSLEIGPYARFLLEGTVNPFIQAGISIAKAGDGDAQTSLYAAFGLEYFINRNTGVFAGTRVINIPFQKGSPISFGITTLAAAGVEWFFNR